jgi:hypothetical protein
VAIRRRRRRQEGSPVANPPPPATPRNGVGACAVSPWLIASFPMTFLTSSPRLRPPTARGTAPQGFGACSRFRTPGSPTTSFAPRAASRTRCAPPPAPSFPLSPTHLPGARLIALGYELPSLQVVEETWVKAGRKVTDYTLYTGSLGIALLLFKSFQVTGDRGDLALAADIVRACDDASRGLP